jgi:predicted amidophosphoribosyltransferase
MCWTAASYEGPTRALILAYKERGMRVLAPVLGEALGRVVAHGLTGVPQTWPVLLVPVPTTAAATRQRYGDHMMALAEHAQRWLGAAGRAVTLAQPLHARPKHDSAELDRVARAEAARSAFEPRPVVAAPLRAGAGDAVVVALDDVLTTGATLAAVARQLARAGLPVAFAATLAATRLRGGGTRHMATRPTVHSAQPVTGSGGWG